jgi:hypothetical protein
MWVFLTVNIMTVVGLPCYYLFINRSDRDYSDIKGAIIGYVLCVVSLILYDLTLIFS